MQYLSPLVSVVIAFGLVPCLLLIGIMYWMYKRHMIIRWHKGGLDKEVRLAQCLHCHRRIVRCLHDRGTDETWEHYDDSTHYHFDEQGKPTFPVEHR